MTIDVAIVHGDQDASDELTRTYHIKQTSAPVAYDGFGTFTVQEWTGDGRTWRLVLILDRNLQWQSGRYSSGMYSATDPDWDCRKAVIEKLWRRVEGRPEP